MEQQEISAAATAMGAVQEIEAHLAESYATQTDLYERIAALEFALESSEWRVLSGGGSDSLEFSREGLRAITELGRLMYLKNPLIKRGVNVQKFYVWGQGWTIHAQDADIQAVIDSFLYNQKNDDSFGSHEARTQLEVELNTDGNLFFCFFVDALTGAVLIRTISFEQIADVLYNPEDSKEPWYYRRQWIESRIDFATGASVTEAKTAYYPDWRYMPTARPAAIGDHPIDWDKPVYHVKVGGFSNWKFGVSEVYAAVDWAKAYKSFLEDWASIVRAYRKFAFQLTTPTAKATAAIKDKLQNGGTAIGAGPSNVVMPPPITGSIFAATEGYKLDSVKTSGATVSADDGRRLLLMVAAAQGLPETFYGDSSVGTLATAKSLDRPTELMMEDRQQLWRDMTLNILNFVTLWAIKAPSGPLRHLGSVQREVRAGQVTETIVWNEGAEDDISVDFPPIIEHDIPSMVTATVQAATLGAPGQLAGTIDLPTLSQILLTTLGVPDADEIVERLFPDGEAVDAPPRPVAEAMMVEAVKELRDAILRQSA